MVDMDQVEDGKIELVGPSFENLPDAAIQLFGGSTDFFSPIGFLNSQIFFLMLPLLLGMLAINLGSGLLAREEQDKTIEGLLARPISRTRLLAAKALAGTLVVLIVTVASLIVTLAVGRLVELEVGAWLIVQATAVCFLLAITFGAVACALSALGKARVASLGIATVLALGGYIVSSLSGTVDWLETPSKLLPFHYYQSEAILRETYNWANTLYLFGLCTVLWLISFLAFRERDLG